MSARRTPVALVPATHAKRAVTPDADFEVGLAVHLRVTMTPQAVIELWGRFVDGTTLR